jgi:hypothetical protein
MSSESAQDLMMHIYAQMVHASQVCRDSCDGIVCDSGSRSEESIAAFDRATSKAADRFELHVAILEECLAIAKGQTK